MSNGPSTRRKKLEALRSRLYGTKTFTAGCTAAEFAELFELAECGLEGGPNVQSLRDGLTETLKGLLELAGTDPLATEALGRALSVLKDGAHFTLRKPTEELRRRKPPKHHLSVRASPSFKELSRGDEYDETCGRLTLILDEDEWAAVKAEVTGQFDGTGNLAYIEMIADMQLRASKAVRDEVGCEQTDVDLCSLIEGLVETAELEKR
jgi:hypothetical protein